MGLAGNFMGSSHFGLAGSHWQMILERRPLIKTLNGAAAVAPQGENNAKF